MIGKGEFLEIEKKKHTHTEEGKNWGTFTSQLKI